MKAYLLRMRQYWQVFTMLTVLLILFWWVDGFSLKDIAVNIAASMATLIGTLFILDVVMQKSKEKELKMVKLVLRDDIAMLANMLASHFTAPLGVNIHDVEESPDAALNLASSSKQMLKMIELVEKRGIEATMQKMSIPDWQEFYMNLMLVKKAIAENIVLYKNLISPQLLGILLKIRSNFNSLCTPFNLLPELFIKEEKDYPANKGGLEASRQYRQGLIKVLAKDLTEYFSSVKELNKSMQELFKGRG